MEFHVLVNTGHSIDYTVSLSSFALVCILCVVRINVCAIMSHNFLCVQPICVINTDTAFCLALICVLLQRMQFCLFPAEAAAHRRGLFMCAFPLVIPPFADALLKQN